VVTGRLAQIAPLEDRRIVLPLTAVAAPLVAVEETGWTVAAVAAEFPDQPSLLAVFATVGDLALNVRREAA